MALPSLPAPRADWSAWGAAVHSAVNGAAAVADIGTPGTATGDALRAAFDARYGAAADMLALTRIEREAALRADASRAMAALRLTKATSWIESWGDLSAWTATGVQVSGGKLYGTTGTGVTGAVRQISIPAGKPFHFTAPLNYTGIARSCYMGVTTSTAPANPDNNTAVLGIIGSGGNAGKIGTFVGSNVTGLASASPQSSAPVAAGVYQFTCSSDGTYISITARKVGTQAEDYCVRLPVSGLPGGGTVNIAISNGDSAGLSGSSWGPLAFVSDMGSLPVDASAAIVEPWTAGTRSPAGVNWRVQVPKTYDSRVPAPLVVFMHQSLTGLASNPYTESRMANVTAALAAAGYLLASSDNGTANGVAGGVNDKYGNQAGLDDYAALIRWCQDHFAIGPILLLGASMGGEFAENMLKQRVVGGIAAVATICPGLDLIAVNANPTYSAPIRTAYGAAADGSDFAAKVEGFNPIAHTGQQLRGVPQRFYVASDDPTAPPATHVTPLVNKLTGVAPEASVVTVTGGHLPAAAYQGSDLVSFFGKYV